MDIVSWLLSRKYTDMSIVGLGSIRGANCTVKDIVHQDGINTVTFEWEGTDGTKKTRDMVVYDGTPIYVWESGNTYHYGDLAIYESQFYRCIVENNDATFDSTKWNEIGSPDENYDIVQSVNLLPARFTAADRKLYYVIDENCFYLWNGTAWVKTISNNIADLDDVNLDDLTEGDVLVWDSVNEKWVNKAKFDEYKTTFVGTQAEWDALTPAQQNVYDIMNITNDGTVLNLGVYLKKKTAMPVASKDEENEIYLYTGTTTQYFKKGVVYQCVSDGQSSPTYSWVALIDFGTAAIKNSTDRVSPNNTDLVESQSVYSAINTALSSIYTPRGDITCAELTSELLISDNIGNVYETSDSGTTTALFLQGAGHPIAVGSNVGVINAGQGRILFNLMANAFDLTNYQKKDLTSAVEGATTVEGALGALSTNKADKVSSATNGDLASLDANGNLADSGIKASYVLRRAPNSSTAVDCNDLVDPFTEYRVGDGDANRPTTGSEAYVIKIFRTGTESTICSQIAYQISGTNVYRRQRSSNGTWSSWEKLVTESDFTSYGIKTIWTGSKTKGDTGMNFDASPYDLCYAQIGGTLCRLVSGMGTGTSGRKKFTAVYAGRDNAGAGTYEQYYILDIVPDGTIATCGWFDIGSKDNQNAKLAGQKALELALAGTSTWTNPTWKTLADVETNVNVTKIIGIKFQTKS